MATQTLTEQELNAPGGMSTIDGGYMTGMNDIPTLSPTTPTTPVAQPGGGVEEVPLAAPQQTIGEQLEGIKTEALRIQDLIPGATEPTAYTAPGFEGDPNAPTDTYEQDRNLSYNQQLKLHQSEIDATNQVYDQLLNEARIQGQGRLGSTRAASARGGLLGSDFGASRKQAQIGANNAQQRGIQAERQAKIGNIMGTVRNAALQELTLKREARASSAEEYSDYLAGKKERRANYMNEVVAGMLAQGVDINEFSEEELNEMGKEAGFKASDLTNAYSIAKSGSDAATAEQDLKTRKTEAEISKLEQAGGDASFSLSGGQARYDSKGNLIASRAKTFAPKNSDTSSAFSSSDEQTLLSGGWSESDMDTIDADVRANGLPAVIENAKANGATDAQISSLNKTYGAEDGAGEQFLTKDYFSKLFTSDQLEKSAEDAGFISGGDDYIPFNEGGDTEGYLTYLEGIIESYREAGYTDKEILKEMQ